MTPKERRLNLFAAEFLGAWNTQDVEEVVACYTPDLSYRDPNTRGSSREPTPSATTSAGSSSAGP